MTLYTRTYEKSTPVRTPVSTAPRTATPSRTRNYNTFLPSVAHYARGQISFPPVERWQRHFSEGRKG